MSIRNLDSLFKPASLAIIGAPAEAAVKVMKELAARGTRAAVVIAAGFPGAADSPGGQRRQALSYKIGQLRISALRAHAERELGAAFGLREFHVEVLRDGPLPLLASKLDHWIAQQRQLALGN